ncbi:arsenate reductase ArsC [Atopomonas sediminilitoris]|uniref:arsenate reductase ArsC n=1 Tax=Atopomonas sediminilitoris TaxID=2919919 RepID=UPI003F943BE2
MNVLILCTGNSCRSIIGEALITHLGQGRLQGFSAGSQPTGQVNPGAIAVLQKHGLDTAGFSSKTWDSFGEQAFDLVITVCDNAAGEACPLYPGRAVKGHWGLPDPAHVSGDAATVAAAFEQTYQQLSRRIEQLLALPIETLDDASLREKLARIGATTA